MGSTHANNAIYRTWSKLLSESRPCRLRPCNDWLSKQAQPIQARYNGTRCRLSTGYQWWNLDRRILWPRPLHERYWTKLPLTSMNQSVGHIPTLPNRPYLYTHATISLQIKYKKKKSLAGNACSPLTPKLDSQVQYSMRVMSAGTSWSPFPLPTDGMVWPNELRPNARIMDSKELEEKKRQFAGIFFLFCSSYEKCAIYRLNTFNAGCLKLPCVSHVFLHCGECLISYILVFMGHELHNSLLGSNFLDNPRKGSHWN